MPFTSSHAKTTWFNFLWHGPRKQNTALFIFFFGFVTQVVGTLAGVHYFPGHFDWQYRVISSLASQIDNPQGYWFFCTGITICFASVFCLGGFLDTKFHHSAPRLSFVAGLLFRMGALAGFAVGIERGLLRNVSSVFYKSHEVIAFFAFAGIFLGLLGFALCWCMGQWRHENFLKAYALFLFVIAPFAATVMSQFIIYTYYRHLGWVSPYWRELGVPVYLSFAFWQWVASLAAFVSMGVLCLLDNGLLDAGLLNGRKNKN